MCKKTLNCNSRIDRCMKPLIAFLKCRGYLTVSCCCGHAKYPMSIIVKKRSASGTYYRELLTNTRILRTKKFYKRDAEGYYYIPEMVSKNGTI